MSPAHTAGVEAPRPWLRNPAKTLVDMAIYNGWSLAERRQWHELARSAVPADAVEAWHREQLVRLLEPYCPDFCGTGAP